MPLNSELQKRAEQLIERARREWPKAASEEALAAWTETQREKWRRMERVCIEGGFDTFTGWILGRYGDDKSRFAGMYFELLEHARTVCAATHRYVRPDMPAEAAAMETGLARDLAEIDARYRAEWFAERWGESIENYKGDRQPSGCVSIIVFASIGLTACVSIAASF